MSDRCLLQVHAHPDDEASKGAGVAARYAAEGVRTVLVTCTGGEAGEILNPAAGTLEDIPDLRAVRLAELDASVAELGYASLHLLGYRDSGMPGTPPNEHPDAFANAPFDEAVGKLVAIVREERPQVMLSYGEDHGGYPHPDHIRAHEIAVAAYDAAADPARFPDAGEPWQIAKHYYMGFTKRRIQTLHDWLIANGKESFFARWIEGPDARDWTDDAYGTRIDVGAQIPAMRRALLAHRTQVAPDSFWFAVPDDVLAEIYPWEDYALARAAITVPAPADGSFETDLFDGID